MHKICKKKHFYIELLIVVMLQFRMVVDWKFKQKTSSKKSYWFLYGGYRWDPCWASSTHMNHVNGKNNCNCVDRLVSEWKDRNKTLCNTYLWVPNILPVWEISTLHTMFLNHHSARKQHNCSRHFDTNINPACSIRLQKSCFYFVNIFITRGRCRPSEQGQCTGGHAHAGPTTHPLV